MDKKFTKLLEKLKMPEKSEYVSDNYDTSDMIKEVSSNSSQLSPEDIRKIHFLESSEGKMMKNPTSTAKGHFQILDKTRQEIKDRLDESEIPVHPERKDALLMSENIKDIERVLENSKNGPYEPSLENVYAGHHYGKQGVLNILNDPKKPLNKARLVNIRKLLNKKVPNKEETVKPAKNLLDLLEE